MATSKLQAEAGVIRTELNKFIAQYGFPHDFLSDMIGLRGNDRISILLTQQELKKVGHAIMHKMDETDAAGRTDLSMAITEAIRFVGHEPEKSILQSIVAASQSLPSAPPSYYASTQATQPQAQAPQQYQTPAVAQTQTTDLKTLKAAIKTLNSFRKELKGKFEEPSEKKLLSKQLPKLIVAAQQRAELLLQDKKIKPKDYDTLKTACEVIDAAATAQRPAVQQQPMLYDYLSQSTSSTIASSPPDTTTLQESPPRHGQFTQALWAAASKPVANSLAKSLGFNEAEILQAFAVINALPCTKDAGIRLDFNSDLDTGWGATSAASDYLYENHTKMSYDLNQAIIAANELLRPYFEALENSTVKSTARKAFS